MQNPPPAWGTRDRPHFFLRGGSEAEGYTSPRRPSSQAPPARDRAAHAARLEEEIGRALLAAREQMAGRDPAVAAGQPGFYLEVELDDARRVALDSLANRRVGIEVVAARHPDEGGPVSATVFVPERAQTYFLQKVRQYRDAETATGRPRNEPLVARMEAVRIASVHSLFTDDDALYPVPGQTVWWEVWLRADRRAAFEHAATRLGVAYRDQSLRFPEREVILALANEQTLASVIRQTDAVAELRRAKDTPALFMRMGAVEQQTWAADLLRRLGPPDPEAPAVCVLDSGVAQAHPLLEIALAPPDTQSIDPAWGTGDSSGWLGHGTAMAGVALYGDLLEVLRVPAPPALRHRLESVKILHPAGVPNDPLLYGAITQEAIARAEVQAPLRRRAVCSAVTSEHDQRGRPSSWSAAIDQACQQPGEERLFVQAAGNVREDIHSHSYLADNDTASIEDPGQAWNALTVGAFTRKVDILDATYAGYVPVSPAGDLSPRSRTSVTWSRQWPVKPDVVFEGGNLAAPALGNQPADAPDDLHVLTTFHRFTERTFTTFGDTSCAAALAGHMAAEILAAHPDLWAETVRGLIVHSAEWTPAMRAHLGDGAANRITTVLRRYGFGVPDLARALRSARNDLTLVVEDRLRPFAREGSTVKTRDMHIHRLPWPRQELEALGAVDAELRVTLSYYVEPNPSDRGWTRRHRYASHGLRFTVKRATERLDEFRRRINRAAQAEDEDLPVGAAAGADAGWRLRGQRDRGSIHSDWWSGSAVDLASCDAIGVYPVGGWWKEKPHLERWDRPARYALIVSVRVPTAEVDIHAPVAAMIGVQAVTQVET